MAQDQMVDVTVQLDRDLKEGGDALFRSLGVNFSVAMNALLKQAVQQGKIPVEIDGETDEPEPLGFVYSKELEEQDPFFNRATQVELHRIIADGEARGEAAFVDYELCIK